MVVREGRRVSHRCINPPATPLQQKGRKVRGEGERDRGREGVPGC